MFGTSHKVISLRRLSEEMEVVDNHNSRKCVLRRHSINSFESFETDRFRDVIIDKNKTVFRDLENIHDKSAPNPKAVNCLDYEERECLHIIPECKSTLQKRFSLPFADISFNAVNSEVHRVSDKIIDIDAEVTDIEMCAEYAEEIVRYMQELEGKWIIPINYLDEQTEVSETSRSILVDWLINVQVHLMFSEETIMLTIKLLDVFLLQQDIQLDNLQLLGVACFFVAAKFFEQNIPKVSQLIYLTDYSYTKRQLLVMEQLVLQLANFELSIPTPIVFLGRFLLAEPHKREISDMCKYLMNLALIDHEFVEHRSSEITSACLLLSRFILQGGNGDEAWTPGLIYYTGYKRTQLDNCVRRLATKLLEADMSEYQGPRRKFALQPKYNSISHHPALNATRLVRKAMKGMLTCPDKSYCFC